MKSISQLVRLVSPSGFSSGNGSESNQKTWNTKEDTSTQHGIYGSSQSDMLLSPLEKRTKLVAQTALNNLFTKAYFDICTLNSVIEAIGKGNKEHPSYKQLKALHCVDYGSMPKDLRDQIPYLVNEVFTDAPAIQATENALKGVF